jgi:DNA-binding XRE family transcriptional regulator
MKARKRKKLEAAGWVVGSTAQFLGLTAEEEAFIEMKLAMSQCLREWRARRRLTQTQLAAKLGSSQSRVAKMEAADPTVSVDLLARSLFKLGAKSKDIARAIA